MEEEFAGKTVESTQNQIKCHDCGAFLQFEPGTETLNCSYCGAANEIPKEEVTIEENDFHAFLESKANQTPKEKVAVINCSGCGASSKLEENSTADFCSFCATPLVVSQSSTEEFMTPQYVLPFKITRKESEEIFVKWIKGLWFAPKDLTNYAEHTVDRLSGNYLPYWTYDSRTNTSYIGERGDHYYVTETYTDSNGKSQTRSVQKTRWTLVSGDVNNIFDDVLVCASKVLPDKMTRELEPWDLEALENFNESYLSGFKSQCYQLDVEDGFGVAKGVMDVEIKNSIRNHIGGDEQRITKSSTRYNDISFKYILLPLWISSYKHKEKLFRFTINARTGEIHGERPYSVIKIALLILAIIAVAGGIYLLVNQGK